MTTTPIATTDRAAPRWRAVVWTGAAALLAAPAVAMRFTDEVRWGRGDFVVFGLMLLAVCACFELVMRRSRAPLQRAAGAVTLATAFLLVWAQVAVGLIGEFGHPGNLLYLALLLAGGAGAALTRLRPLGMARVTMGLAVGQGAISAVAALAGWPHPWWGSAFFIVLWVLASLLYFRAAMTDATDD